MTHIRTVMAATAMALALAGAAAHAEQGQPGRDACVEKLRQQGGPDALNGIEVTDTQWSQAGTRVTMRDAGGTVWQCLGYDDGTAEVPTVVNAADDGEGAMAGSSGTDASTTATTVVQFSAGSPGAAYDGSLTTGSSMRYVLDAGKDQFLDVQLTSKEPLFSYQIFNPDGTFLLALVGPDTPYRGQLLQSGKHVVEVINRGDATAAYHVTIGIE